MSNKLKEKERTAGQDVALSAIPIPNSEITAKSGASSKLGKAKDTMSLLATSIPVIGFLGTLAVWAVTNYYVGDVVITTDKPYTSLTVKAFDKKGQESTFHTPRFQLMPGSYHLEIQTDSGKTQHADATVDFQKTATVVSNSEPETNSNDAEEASQKKKHWWQLFRRSEN